MGAEGSKEISGQLSVDLALEKTTIIAGETLRAYLDLNVFKDQKDIKISVECMGVQTTWAICHCTHDNCPGHQQQESVIHHAVADVVPWHKDLRKGFYRKPFIFPIPSTLPSSVRKQEGSEGSKTVAIRIFYNIGIVIERKGLFRKNLIHRVAFDIISPASPPVMSNAMTSKQVDQSKSGEACATCWFMVVIPICIPCLLPRFFGTLCMKWGGTIKIDAKTDKDSYESRDSVQVSYLLDDSGHHQHVMGVKIFLVECMKVGANGTTYHLDRFPGDVHIFDHDPANTLTQNLQLPSTNDFCPSMKRQNLHIRHYVRIEAILELPCFFNEDPPLEPKKAFKDIEIKLSQSAKNVTSISIEVDPEDGKVIPISKPIKWNPAAISDKEKVGIETKGLLIDLNGDGVLDAWHYTPRTGDESTKSFDSSDNSHLPNALDNHGLQESASAPSSKSVPEVSPSAPSISSHAL